MNTRQLRTRRLLYACGTSLLSKVSAVAVQFIAFPVAIRCLGSAGFVLYTMVASFLAWLALASIGAGPALTVVIATADAKSDVKQQALILSSVFILTLIVVVPFTAILIPVVLAFPVCRVFGPQYAHDEQMIVNSLLFIIALLFLHAIFSIVEAAQLGFQEQHHLNIRGSFSNLLSIAAILLVLPAFPSVLALLMAVQVPSYATRLANALLFFRNRPFLLPKFSLYSWEVAAPLFFAGVVFLFAACIGNYLCHYFPIILAGRSFSSDAAATFASVMNLMVLAAGMISMVTIPMRSGIGNAIASNDTSWIQRMTRYVFLAGTTFSILFAAFLLLFGQSFFYWWLGETIRPDRLLLGAMGCYFILGTWENLYFALLIGYGQVIYASLVFCGRSIVAATILLVFHASSNLSFPFVLLSGSVILITLPLFALRLKVVRRMRITATCSLVAS